MTKNNNKVNHHADCQRKSKVNRIKKKKKFRND